MLFSPQTPYFSVTSPPSSESGEWQAIFLGELLVRLDAVAADAQHRNATLLQRVPVVAEAARLGGAAGGIVLRIEIQHHVMSTERRERHQAGHSRAV